MIQNKRIFFSSAEVQWYDHINMIREGRREVKNYLEILT